MRVTLYGRPECPLCEEVREELQRLQSHVPHELVEVNIESDSVLRARFAEQIPVVVIGPYTLRAPIAPVDLLVTLQAYAQSPHQEESRGSGGTGAHRLLHFVSRHWLALFNLVILMYVGVAFLAPVLMKAGAERPAHWIYKAYSPLCHQWAFRSWFLFGEQPAYPRALAGTTLTTLEQAAGIPDSDLRAAREFIGNDRLGYKVALCQRDVAIYAGLLLGGMAYAGLRRRLKPMPIWAWAVFGVLPVALDGGSQFLGAFPFLSWFARESTPLLRTLTGLAFGLSNVWLAYPSVEETMTDARVLTSARLAGTRGEQGRRAP